MNFKKVKILKFKKYKYKKNIRILSDLKIKRKDLFLFQKLDNLFYNKLI